MKCNLEITQQLYVHKSVSSGLYKCILALSHVWCTKFHLVISRSGSGYLHDLYPVGLLHMWVLQTLSIFKYTLVSQFKRGYSCYKMNCNLGNYFCTILSWEIYDSAIEAKTVVSQESVWKEQWKSVFLLLRIPLAWTSVFFNLKAVRLYLWYVPLRLQGLSNLFWTILFPLQSLE